MVEGVTPHTTQMRKDELGTGEGRWTGLEDKLKSLIGDSGSLSFSGTFSPVKIFAGQDLAKLDTKDCLRTADQLDLGQNLVSFCLW